LEDQCDPVSRAHHGSDAVGLMRDPADAIGLVLSEPRSPPNTALQRTRFRAPLSFRALGAA
jgi:hypothetical protein